MARVYPVRHIPAAKSMANTRFTRNTDRYHKNLYPGLSIFSGSSLQRESKDVLQMGSTAISEREMSQRSACRSLKGLQLQATTLLSICFSVHIFLSLMAGSLKVTMIHLSSGNKYQNHPACTSMTEIIQLKIWYQQGNMLSGNTQTCLFIIFF